MASFVLFAAAGQTWALPASSVVQVLRMAAVSPAPGAPPHVRGVLNVHGRLVTVIDVRVRLGAAPRPARPSDRLLLVEDGGRLVALEVDEVQDVVTREDAVQDDPALARSPLVAGALRLEEGVVLVHAAESWVRAGAGVEAGGAAEAR